MRIHTVQATRVAIACAVALAALPLRNAIWSRPHSRAALVTVERMDHGDAAREGSRERICHWLR